MVSRSDSESFRLVENSHIHQTPNINGAEISDDRTIGSLVEIQSDPTIVNRCRVQSHAFACSLVTIKDDVFVSDAGKLSTIGGCPGEPEEWEAAVVREGASIGTNATLVSAEAGENAMAGADVVDGYEYVGVEERESGEPLTVVHAPTDRELKRTSHRIDAVESLQREGYEI